MTIPRRRHRRGSLVRLCPGPAPRRRLRRALLAALLAAAVRPPLASAQAFALEDLSLEELMDVEVTLVSRRPRSVASSPAAVTVVTGEELVRAGVRTLPDALRLVPGLQVGQVDANKWVVTARGFAGLFSNKLLVLVDGRSVYTPLFAGVFWESQSVLLEDVERIEVIRGPGGTLWGANAVNGIVNVVTRRADASRGLYATVGGGAERRFVAVRRGADLGGHGSGRVYVERVATSRSRGADALPVRDDWHMSRAGFRADLDLSPRDQLTVQGDASSGVVGESLRLHAAVDAPATLAYYDAEIFGADLLARWQRTPRRWGEELELQAYYDLYDRQERLLSGASQTLDLDAHHRVAAGAHRIVWGAAYRVVADRFDGSFAMRLEPPARTRHLFSAFAHDDYELSRDRLRLSVGTKVERNDATGVEWQPDLRLWCAPGPGLALWASAARAVRTPARGDLDIRAVLDWRAEGDLFPGAPPTLVTLFGSNRVGAERVVALEAGTRAVLGGGWAADVAVYHNRYADLLTHEPGLPYAAPDPGPPHLVLPVRARNLARAATAGLEATLEWDPRPWWQLRGVYTLLDMDVDLVPGSLDLVTWTYPGESPRQQFGLRSLSEAGGWSLCASARWIDAIANPGIDAYTTVDARAARRLGAHLELALTGRNLLQSRHREAVSNVIGAVHTAVEREGYASLAWRP